MTQQPSLERFKGELLKTLEETFERHHGIFLDKGTSLFETLDGIDAAQASRSIIETGATIAAHVEHTRFYLDVLETAMRAEKSSEPVDWGEIWARVRVVSPAEWERQKRDLRESYRRTIGTIEN